MLIYNDKVLARIYMKLSIKNHNSKVRKYSMYMFAGQERNPKLWCRLQSDLDT